MVLFPSSHEYLFQLYATSSKEAKKMWKQNIKESWENKCAYCGSVENLTIDHIVPLSKGGSDVTNNVICCCKSCNQNKGHNSWEKWYLSQEFFNMAQYNRIKKWMNPIPQVDLFKYGSRRNNVN